MVDRRLVFGDPADAGTRWAMDDAAGSTGGGNFVLARDLDGGGVLLRYNPTSGNFEPFAPVDMGGEDILNGSTTVYDAATDTVGDGTTSANHESINTDDATIGGYPASKAIGQGDSVTLHSADGVSVNSDSFQTIFDVATPVDVIGGMISGQQATTIRVTWDDGTTDSFFVVRSLAGVDQGGDGFTALYVPPLDTIQQLEFRNDSSSAKDYGYGVLTT